MKPFLKLILKRPYLFIACNFFDPIGFINRIRAIPVFFRNLALYNSLNTDHSFRFRLGEIWYRTYERYSSAGAAAGHYFFQDLWAAKYLFDAKVRQHVDVGSRMDGFVAHVLPFCHVTYVDIRDLKLDWEGFTFCHGSITQMPFADNSIPSLSCLHVIEHIGLGRYGDPVEPDGYLRSANELSRVLQPGGILQLGTPVGRQRLCFDGHRVFDPQTIVNAFSTLQLVDFSLINDRGERIIESASFDEARRCSYGCGLFRFEKQSRPT